MNSSTTHIETVYDLIHDLLYDYTENNKIEVHLNSTFEDSTIVITLPKEKLGLRQGHYTGFYP